MRPHHYAQNIYAAALNAWRNYDAGELSPRSYSYRINWLKLDTGATTFAAKLVALHDQLYKTRTLF